MGGKNRKLNRWPGFDYSQSGLYFITVCTHKRTKWFGDVNDGKMILNGYGKIADNLWHEIPNHYSGVIIDVRQIMPNHMHGIIQIVGTDTVVGTEHCSVPTDVDAGRINGRYGLISKIMKSYKEMVVKTIHKQLGNFEFSWQRSFYDRVIRNNDELNRIREYIVNNPAKWEFDRNNPELN